jgi:hypothetical protein
MCKTTIFLLGFETEQEDGGGPPGGTVQRGRRCFGAQGAQGRGENGEETKGDSRACSPWRGKTAGELAADSHGNWRRSKVVAVFRRDSGDEMWWWSFSMARWSF